MIVVPKRDGKVYVIEPVDTGRAGIDFVREVLKAHRPITDDMPWTPATPAASLVSRWQDRTEA